MCSVKKRCSSKWLFVKLPAANDCSYYGLTFITWKCNTKNKSWLWLQNWLRHTCNVVVFTFIKHLFKRRDVLHIRSLVEKMTNHILLTWQLGLMLRRSNRSLSKFVLPEKFVKSFGILHLSRLQKHEHASNNPVYHQHVYLAACSLVFPYA